MKSSSSLLRLVPLFTAVMVSSLFSKSAEIGQSAPDFSLIDIYGQTHQLSDYEGKTVVLEWVNPECPFVVKHYKSGNIPSLQKSAAEDGVVWLAINSGKPGAQGDFDPAEADTWMAKMGSAPAGYLRDQTGEIGRQYAAKTTPHMFVINDKGVLVYDGAIDSIPSSRISDLDKAENYVTAALSAMKSGELPAKPKSSPYGCGVKY